MTILHLYAWGENAVKSSVYISNTVSVTQVMAPIGHRIVMP